MTSPDLRCLGPEDLMASPRGRSLVFALAIQSPSETVPRCKPAQTESTTAERAYADLAESVFLAAYRLDRRRGIGSEMFGPGAEEGKRQRVSPADVASKLRLVEPRIPTQSTLQKCMGEVIGGAMYWQPPHSTDVLCTDPNIVEALRPWARALVDSGLLQPWSETVDLADQWTVAWDGAVTPEMVTDNVEPGASSTKHLETWVGDLQFSETRCRRDFAKNPDSAGSGPWDSTPPSGLWLSTGTWPGGEPVGLDLVEDDFGLERARACRLQIRVGARLYEINHQEDWAHLCRKYPLDVTAQRRQVWFETTGRRGRWVIPDWRRVAEEFDGVHVSLAGYLRTAGAVVAVGERTVVADSAALPTAGNTDDATASLMAGWNPDATYWLNDTATGIAEVVDWVFDDDADEWVRR